MRAAVFHGPHDIRLSEVTVPEPQKGWVLIKVKACGICGTDVHINEGEAPAISPVILGHEFAGEVVAVGSGVTRLSIGDKVAVDPNIACGQCPQCRAGKVHLCDRLQAIGVTLNGGFAEYCMVPEVQAHRFEEGLSFVEAAMVEPVACCLHGIDLAGMRAGESVAIFGAGFIGLILLQLGVCPETIQVPISPFTIYRRSYTYKARSSTRSHLRAPSICCRLAGWPSSNLLPIICYWKSSPLFYHRKRNDRRSRQLWS